MNKREATELLAYAGEVWPNYHLPSNPNQFDMRVTVWMDILGDLDASLLRTVIARLAGRDFPPTPGQVRQEALRALDLGIPDPDLMLAEVQRAISECGYMGVPSWSHPAVSDAVTAFGGWLRICESENEDARRAHLLQAYESAASRHLRDAALPTDLPAIGRRVDDELEAGDG
jgi:hypothetical protein